MSGRMLSEGLGKLSFWLMFVGFNVTFLIQHSAGLSGMPRRIYDYDSELGVTAYNLVSTIGSFILGIGVLVTASTSSGPQAGQAGGQRPLAGQHARVVHELAPAGQQLRRDPARAQRRADEGHPARGGGGREARRDRVPARRAAQRVVASPSAPVQPGMRKLVLATGIATFALIILGGVVRVSDSGLGCGPAGSGFNGWPFCNGDVVPGIDLNSIIEYTHRALAIVVGFMILSLFVLAWRRYRFLAARPPRCCSCS